LFALLSRKYYHRKKKVTGYKAHVLFSHWFEHVLAKYEIGRHYFISVKGFVSQGKLH